MSVELVRRTFTSIGRQIVSRIPRSAWRRLRKKGRYPTRVQALSWGLPPWYGGRSERYGKVDGFPRRPLNRHSTRSYPIRPGTARSRENHAATLNGWVMLYRILSEQRRGGRCVVSRNDAEEAHQGGRSPAGQGTGKGSPPRSSGTRRPPQEVFWISRRKAMRPVAGGVTPS